MKTIDWRYPLLWGADFKSTYRSLWLGWILITWCQDPWDRQCLVSFQPGT